MGSLPVLEGLLACTHMCVTRTDVCVGVQVVVGFLPRLRYCWVLCPGHPSLLCLSGPSPIHGLTASRQPQLSVVADVWPCHGNARTGRTSGLQ